MTHDELIEQVAREICLVTGRMGDPLPIELQRVDRDWGSHIPAAKAAISAIYAALQEPTDIMMQAYWDGSEASDSWGLMLNASALGE
ncbi:hypothetical protein [Brucella anthropi]|uniref:hypothetical protein n=1 Tax=Brucella anthropi TaxID=529 RepID=UPI000F663127|nr:hypothetical protein [Brucella anthropi]RRY03849.1 hypothetical protein EGJ58_22375 [Brucella anthropi]